jgi:hypothetical protein
MLGFKIKRYLIALNYIQSFGEEQSQGGIIRD